MSKDNTITITTPVQDVAQTTMLARLMTWAQMLKITSEDERAQAIDIARKVKASAAKHVAQLADVKSKSHAAWKAICDLETAVTKPSKTIEDFVKEAANEWDAEQQLIRDEAARLAQAQAEELARKERERLEKQAAKLKTPELREARLEQAAAVVAVIPPAAPAPERKAESTAVIWYADVTDPALVPREYMVPDQKALDALAKATKGKLTLAGVAFRTKQQLAFR